MGGISVSFCNKLLNKEFRVASVQSTLEENEDGGDG